MGASTKEVYQSHRRLILGRQRELKSQDVSFFRLSGADEVLCRPFG